MKASQLIIKNFMGIGNGTLNFNDRGLVLVEGINHSSPTSKSNGASKSSIYEAIQWVLFGTTKRNLKADDVVNEQSEQDCEVTFFFDEYKVVRYRKHTKYANGFFVYRLDGMGWTDISKGTAKDTQVMLEEILGMGEVTFSKVVCFGQGDVKSFASLTDTEIKRVFEEALGLTFFAEDMVKIKEARQEVEEKIKNLDAEYTRLTQDAFLCVEMMGTLAEASKRGQEANEARLRGLQEEASFALTEYKQAKAKADDSPAGLEEHEKRVAEVEAQVARLLDLRQKFSVKLNAGRSKWHGLSAEANVKSDKADEIKASMKNARDRVGSPCPTCGKAFKEEDITAFIRSSESLLAEAMEALKAKLSELEDVHHKLADMEELGHKLDWQIEEAQHLKAQVVAAGSDFNAWKAAAGQVAVAEARCKRVMASINEAKAYSDPNTEKIRELERRKQLAEQNADIVMTSKGMLNDELAIINMLAESLGNSGLKSYIFDSVTPELNKIINKICSALDDIEIEISTLKRLKSGDVREKFDIKVVNKHGSSVYEGNSGGEKQKINFALSLAFNTLVRALSPKSWNFIFLDEVFESLDDGSSEPVMELCAGITAEIPNVFLMTHQPQIKELVKESFTVEKHGKMATFSF